ncbi:MAG TPA: hypothetical protein VGP44_08330 [Gemmatimonadales bacterium]|nr:hypothetical protein [Gemmatimonadales bacterium]
MRRFSTFALTLTVAAIALLAPKAHAQGADLQGRWTDPSATYLITAGEGIPINPPEGGGGGAWFEYTAYVTYADGSALMTEDGTPIDYTITAQLHGNAATGFQVEIWYAIRVHGFVVDRGRGHLLLSGNQTALDGYWKDADGSTGRMVLFRLRPDQAPGAP